MRQQVTKSLCNVCYGEIPAVADPFNDVAPMIYKMCPEHGLQRGQLETDRDFYGKFSTYERNNHYPVLIINVTNRCNITCPHCFYPIKNDWDMSLDKFKEVVNHYKQHFTAFIISGGDPTCWKYYFDAAEWCKSEGIQLSQLTNGVRFSDPSFLDRALSLFRHQTPLGNLFNAEISIHPKGYNTDEVRDKQLAVLAKLRESGTKISCIMTNVDPKHTSSLELTRIIEEVLDFAQEWRDVALTFRIRPICFGWASKQKPKIFLSQLTRAVRMVAMERGYTMVNSHKKDIDNIYNQNFSIDGIDVVTVCAAPSVENIDIGYLNRGPWMLANDGLPYSVPHALIVNEGIDKGYYQGRKLESISC